MSAIRIDPPHLGLARALSILYPERRPTIGVSPAAHVGKDVVIGKDVNVYPGVYLGDGARVGDGTDLFPASTWGRERPLARVAPSILT